MINVSNDFKTRTKKIKQQNVKLGILGGELTVKEVHFMPVSTFNKLPVWMLKARKEVIAKELKYSFEGNLFKTIMKQIEITVKNAIELKDKNVNFQYGIYVDNKFEYIDIGDFYIKDIEDNKGKSEIIVTGYDKMINFMKTFKQSDLQLTYPCTLLELIQRMCEICGVELYSTDFFNADLEVEEDYFTAQELTYRDVLEKVAESTLTTIFIKDNKLYLHKLASGPVEKLDASYLTGMTVKEKFGPVNALVLGRGDVEDNLEAIDDTSIAQNGRCEIRFDENEFVEYKREQIIDEMFEQIKGLEYYAFEGSDVGVMWLEPCDVIEVEDNEENTYKTIYLSTNITINTGISSDIEADIPEETNTEYKVTTKEEKKTLKVERLAKKNEGLIKDYIEETGENSEKISSLIMTVDGLQTTVSKKVGSDKVISSINQTAEEIKIQADKISLEGLITANENCKILEDGSIEAKNAKFENCKIITADEDGTVYGKLLLNIYSAGQGNNGAIMDLLSQNEYYSIEQVARDNFAEFSIQVDRPNTIQTPFYIRVDDESPMIWLGNLGGTTRTIISPNRIAFDILDGPGLQYSNGKNLLRADTGTDIVNGANSEYRAIKASAFTQASSKRYKENIEDLTEDEASKILDLDVVSFDYKKDSKMEGKKVAGLIAEDVEKIIPNAVIYEEKEGKKIPDGLDYSKFVPYLIKEIQMLKKEIEELKEENNA